MTTLHQENSFWKRFARNAYVCLGFCLLMSIAVLAVIWFIATYSLGLRAATVYPGPELAQTLKRLASEK